MLLKAIKNWWDKSDFWPGRYSGNYADYPGVGKVYDRDAAEYAVKHLRLLDRLDPIKVGLATLDSQAILFGVLTEKDLPKKKNWKF